MGRQTKHGGANGGAAADRSHRNHHVLRRDLRLARPPPDADLILCHICRQRLVDALVSECLSSAICAAPDRLRHRLGRHIRSDVYFRDGAAGSERTIEHSASVYVHRRSLCRQYLCFLHVLVRQRLELEIYSWYSFCPFHNLLCTDHILLARVSEMASQ